MTVRRREKLVSNTECTFSCSSGGPRPCIFVTEWYNGWLKTVDGRGQATTVVGSTMDPQYVACRH